MQGNLTCPSCCHNFGTKDPLRPHGPRMPLLLDCGHTFCEGCIKNLSKLSNAIPCPLCQTITALRVEEGGIKALLPDVYMLGLLTLARKTIDQEQLKLIPAGLVNAPKKKTSKTKKPLKKCENCSSAVATCKCMRCDSSICDPCFTKVHSMSKILQNHWAVPLTDDDIPSLYCEEHNTQKVYFCEEDKISICGDCVLIGNHKGHPITPLSEKNKAAIAELEPAMSLAHTVYKKLKKSDKVLSDCLPEVHAQTSQLRSQIKLSFQVLHGALQAREKVLMRALADRHMQELAPLQEAKENIFEKMKEIEELSKDARKILKKPDDITNNAQRTLDRLKGVQKVPCHLENSDINRMELRYLVEKDMITSIREFGNIETIAHPYFSMKLLEEVSDDGEEEDDEDKENVSVISGPTTSSATSDDVIIEEVTEEVLGCTTISTTNSVADNISESNFGSIDESAKVASSKKRTIRKQKVKTFQQEVVSVKHVVNPCRFIVHRQIDADRFRSLENSMSNWALRPDSSKDIPQSVNPGDFVLAQYTRDNRWYRAQVKLVIVDNESGLAKQKVQLYYLDYGNSETVPLNRLRKLPNKFMKVPEMAVLCSLIGIVPPAKKKKWTQEGKDAFAVMAGDKPMLMSVVNHSKDMLHVDLSKPPNEDIEDDRPVSVRDALVFLELACFESPASIELPGATRVTPQRKYLKPEPSIIGEQSEVIISHVNSPSDFYVQLVGEESRYLFEMMNDLQSTYNREKGNLWSVFCPQKGMVCVAQYTDNRWYRAIVTNLPGRRKVEVHYVDFGNNQILTHYKLRKILNKFMVLPTQALHCKLADVEPKNPSEGWEDSAKGWLTEYFNKELLGKVVGVEDETSMVLYDTNSEPTVCLNSEILKEYPNLINCTGPNASGGLPLPYESISDMLEQSGEDSGLCDKTHSPSPVPDSSSSSHHSYSPDTVKDNPEYSNPTDNKPIKVSYVKSPTHFYIQLATAHEDGLQGLMSDLAQTYNDSEDVPVSWNEPTFCAVHAAAPGEEKCWYRGKITQTLSETKFQVILLDYGYTVEVDRCDLRPLETHLQEKSCFAVLCHLADIQPAGDPNKWSITACEEMTNMVTDKELFIHNKGLVGNSLASDLLVKEVIAEDALSVARQKFHSVTKMLVDKGLAIPTKRIFRYRKTKIEEEKEDMLPGATIKSPTDMPAGLVASALPSELPLGSGPEAIEGAEPVSLSSPAIDETPGEPEVYYVKYYPEPDLPTERSRHIIPTYVDYHGNIFAQEYKDDTSPEGKFGYLLKEVTLETMLQDAYLTQHGKHRFRIPRDGNCLFRVFAQGIFGDQSSHISIRARVVGALRGDWDLFAVIVGDVDKEEYLKNLASDGFFGGEPEIQLICYVYKIQVLLYIGGLCYPIQQRQYGNSLAPCVEIVYISDGLYDSGHYDLIADSDLPNPVYLAWRKGKIAEITDSASPNFVNPTYYDDSVLSQLMDVLQKEYEKRGCDVDEDTKWEVGEACVAKFSQDDGWYRGRISRVDEKGVLVHYVDFGNCEYVPNERLRKHVILTDIPAQCTPYKLYNIETVSEDGKWPKEVLEHIHGLTVNKKCHVIIREPPVVGCPVEVDLQLDTDYDLGSLLMYSSSARKINKDNLFDLHQEEATYSPIVPEEAVEDVDTSTPSPPPEDAASPLLEIPETCDASPIVSASLESPPEDATAPLGSPEQCDAAPIVSAAALESQTSPSQPGDEGGDGEGADDEDASFEGSDTEESPQEPVVHSEESPKSPTPDEEEQEDPAELIDSLPTSDAVEPDSLLLLSEQEEQELPEVPDNLERDMALLELPENPFREQTKPAPGENFAVTVTHVDHPGQLYIQCVKQEDSDDEWVLECNAEIDTLVVMAEMMNNNAAEYEDVTDPKPGVCYCGCFSFDNCWYRAAITTIDGDKIGVRYVDYGNSEYITIDRLKMLPVEFQELPAQASRYKVAGVIPASGDIWREKDGLAMVNTLENKAMVASITENGHIEVFDEVPVPGRPKPYAYRSLIQENVLAIEQEDWFTLIEEESGIDLASD